MLDVEVNGVKSIKAAGMPARFVFIAPPSVEALRARLTGRGSETEESLAARLHSAEEALEYSRVPGAYDKVIVNDNVDQAYEEFKAFALSD